MSPENQSPTNEPIENASQESHGGDIGGELSENDFIRYFNGKHKPDGSNESTAAKSKEGKANTDASFDEPVIDLSELDDDSTESDAAALESDSTDTKTSDDEDREEDPLHELLIDGENIKVKLSELKADAQKVRASESKFKEASDMRKEADEIKDFYQKDRDSLKNVLAQYQNFMQERVTAQQPDWYALLQNDPLEYIRQKEYHQAVQQQLAQAKQQQESIQKQEELERSQAAQKNIATQRSKAYQMFPQWKNPEVFSRDEKLITNYLNEVGFTPEEQGGLQDVRMLDVVYKAAKYDQAVKAKDQKKAKPSTGKTLTSGVSQAADPGYSRRQEQTAGARTQKALNDRFKQDGDFDSFKAMFTNQLKSKR